MFGKKSLSVLVLLLFSLVLSACSFSLIAKPYNVQGKVVDATGNGVQGVVLSFTGDFTGSATTDVNGNWSMAGLKGTVKVTPVKEGMTFSPGYVTVSAEKTNVNFTAATTSNPESEAKSVVNQFFQGMVDGDAEAIANLLHESYYVTNEIAREEMIQHLMQEFEEADYSSFNYQCANDSTFGETEAIVKGELTMDVLVPESQEEWLLNAFLTFALIKTESGWRITYYFEYSPDEAILKNTVRTFLDAFKNEDLTTIQSLLSSTYVNSDILSILETNFADIEVSSYVIDTEDYARYFDDNSTYLEVTMTVTDTTMVTTEQLVHVHFNFVEENGEWVINNLSMICDAFWIQTW